MLLRHFTNTTYFLGGIFPASIREKNDYILNESAVLLVSSMMFAIQEINDNKDILPGVKIGKIANLSKYIYYYCTINGIYRVNTI